MGERAVSELWDYVSTSEHEATALFSTLAAAMPARTCLHLGAKRSLPERSTLEWAKTFLPAACEHIGVDIEGGQDVHLVADVHEIGGLMPDSFDAVVSLSTHEHLERPWEASAAICKVLHPGGLLLIQTHQTFPLHYYPNDYWRFSRGALEVLCGPRFGFEVLHSSYEYPCSIISSEDGHQANAWLLVWCVARKI